ncbi:MAG: hypothetical protein CMO66_07500 [Verrucomicrobiales bacterium]|nr:hypothetical protein [Verrucomicrobiales bacterium]
MHRRHYKFFNVILLGCCFGFFTACNKPQIEAYGIPAEPPPPEGWVEMQTIGPEKIRYGVFEGDDYTGITATVTVLEGDGGGLEPNINRWRGQLGLGKIEGADLNATLEEVPSLGKDARMVDVNGTSVRSFRESRTVGVIVPRTELTWFYKFSGPPANLEVHKADFLDFIQHWQ